MLLYDSKMHAWHVWLLSQGCNALMEAAKGGHEAVVSLLLMHDPIGSHRRAEDAQAW